MINIIIPNKDNILFINYFFIYNKYKLILLSDFKKEFIKNNTYLFIDSLVYPIKFFIKKLKKLIENKIDFINLSDDSNVYLVNGSNITFVENEINIKKTNKKIILFNKNYNKIDNIVPPFDLNFDYLFLLNHKTYDSKINLSIAYKAYEKYLANIVKENCCFNFVLFVNNIVELRTVLPKYKFYRLTLFHCFKNEDDIMELKLFCMKNKILSCYYTKNRIFYGFKTIWFEKIVLINNLSELNDTLINKLNSYHKFYENLVLKNCLSIKSSDFVLIPFNYKTTIDYDFLNIVKNYMYCNLKNCYYYKKYNNKYMLVFKQLDKFKESQLMNIRDYITITNDIDNQIKMNYDINKLGHLLIKKVSIGSLCKNEKDLLIDMDLIIDSLNNYEYLNDLVILFSYVKNQNIITKLYTKVLKLGIDKKITMVTLKCFKSLITSNINETTLDVIFDFLDYLHSKDQIKTLGLNENNIKFIITTLFYSVSKFYENKNIMSKFKNLISTFFDFNDLTNINSLIKFEKDNRQKENNLTSLSLIHFLIFITTDFSAFYSTTEEFLNKRNEIKNNILLLLEKDLPTCGINDIMFVPVSNFYLAYQGIPSNDIFTLKTKLIRKLCPELNYKINTNFTNKKINICFHSNFLTRWHSVFKDRHQIIKELANKPEYNVFFSTYDELNNDVKYLFGNAKHIILGNKNLKEISELFTDMKLDVLVYCEIGMDPKSFFLAFMKLAKIQINTWGHSDSSGIDTIDYFFSSKLYELPYEESQTHYSEKLILQNSLCTSYVNPLSRYNILKFKNRYEYGFTDEVKIFFCAQSLFKFNPIFDNYIVEILESNSNFILVILNNESKQKVISRFNNKNITSRIHIFPGMDHFNYLNLMNISDIILDPYPFGGCNSSLEAFSLGKIVITHASNMINGRFTAGFYKKMELENLITNSKDEYINLALTFANDIKYKIFIENQIKEKANVLFNDQESIDEWDNDIKKILKY